MKPGATYLLCVLLGACNFSPAPAHEGATSFDVNVSGADLGSESSPLPFSETGGLDFDLTVSPVGGPFDGWVTIRAEPGEIAAVSGPETSGPHARLLLAEGEEATLSITVVLAFSKVRIWVDDEGYLPTTGVPAACADGADNDGDGYRDHVQDPGCVDETDGSEEGGSWILGVSNVLIYENPRVADVQGSGWKSPLEDETVTIDRGRLVVTAISTEGFYVTDIDPAAPAGGANSLFVYNYRTPWYLRECDIVTNLSGIVGEFYHYSELKFPSWDVVDPEGRVPEPASRDECPIPDPTVLDATIASDFPVMETFESGLVRVVDGRIGSDFRNCDYNGNGTLEHLGPEGDCSDACYDDAECTEVSGYFKYGQYAVVLDGCTGPDCTKVLAVTRHVVPDFWADHHVDMAIPYLTGTLRHFSPFTDDPSDYSLWIVEARCADDLVCNDPYCGTSALLPMWEACVPEYARGEHYDDN